MINNEIILIIKKILSICIAIICLRLSRDRYKENIIYAEDNVDNKKGLILRWIFTNSLKWLGVAIIIGTFVNWLDAFTAFYILTPMLIALNILFFINTDRIMGIMTFIKGFYYLGLTIISIVQFLFNSEDKTVIGIALGFTLSLAIFESITALSDGYSKMRNAKKNLNNKN